MEHVLVNFTDSQEGNFFCFLFFETKQKNNKNPNITLCWKFDNQHYDKKIIHFNFFFNQVVCKVYHTPN